MKRITIITEQHEYYGEVPYFNSRLCNGWLLKSFDNTSIDNSDVRELITQSQLRLANSTLSTGRVYAIGKADI